MTAPAKPIPPKFNDQIREVHPKVKKPLSVLHTETSWTDVTNAQLFAETFKDKIVWCKKYGGWYVYNGKIWQRDENNSVKKHAVEIYKILRDQLKTSKVDAIVREPFARHVKATGNDGKLNAMVNRAEAFMGVAVEEFDANSDLFCCNNGVLNIKTNEFLPFRAEDMLTRMTAVDYIREATCPVWMKFLDDIFLGNQEVIDFTQRIVGYSMTTSIDEHCMFIFYGQGRNGKTTFIETISKIFGAHCISLSPDSIMGKKNTGIPNDIARLKDARMVKVSEGEENVKLEEALIKRLTGGDQVTARFLNREFFDFYPVFKMFLYTNKKPNIRGTDTGIWRRIRMIPFELNLTKEQEDRDLSKKLNQELPGILSWAVEGCRKWQESGLRTPQRIIDATIEYQSEEDDLGQFIEDYCIADIGKFISVDAFKDKFKQVNGYIKSQKTISEYMRRHGHRKNDNRVILPNGTRIRVYSDIRFRDIYTAQEKEKDLKPTEKELQEVWND